ncbi:S-layer homology domain-containing protein [Thermus caliditerrae]|uniref:S-layer homology domain-containing protein n=1 Tax=Thermus caliditerrae TaxID=1330700 RepID=UPI001F3631B5|nr:S-layer homology domain-containing protein [Thermus caliditerrae]
MKKRLVTLLAGLLTVLSMGFGLAQFSDVPAGHWAKEAVEGLAAKGILVGFPDGTFRGNETLTRYQAALIIYRLLQQIEEELKAKGESPTMEAMSSEDIEALKNAVQELAAELAALGVRVSALEDSAATKEDIARLEAMIEELKAQPMPEPGMDQAALQDLADRVEAASIAADTALAQAQQLAEQLEALAQDVEGVKGDLAALQTQVEANAQAIQALNELAVLLNQDVLALQDRVTALEKMVSGGAEMPNLDEFASKEDVAAVQEFAAALRSDLVGLSEKVSKLEGTVGDLSGKVSKLERNALSISGSLRLRYQSSDGSFSGYDYDRIIPGSILSSGDADGDGQSVDDADAGIANASGKTSALLNLTLKTGALDAKSSPSGANTYPGLFQFSIRLGTPGTGIGQNNPGSYDGTGATLYNLGLAVDSIKTTLGIAEGQTLSFTFGQSVNTHFTEYVMDNEDSSLGHGFVATLKGLPLGATLTAAYGEKDPSTPNYDYFKAVRLAVAPSEAFSFGLSYAQHDNTFAEVAGVDGSLALGPVKLSGEYFRFGANVMSSYQEGGYVKAELGPVKANYRGLAPGAAPDPAGLSLDDDNPFRWGQRGFTVETGLPLLGLNVGLLYNVQMDGAFGTPDASAFKATFGLGLPAGFSLSAGATLASNTSGEFFPATFNFTGVPGPATATDYATALTATLKHNGAAENALIKGLNLTFAYTNRTLLGGPSDSLAAYGDFGGLALGPISVDKVVFRYNDANLQNPAAGQTLKGGIKGGLNLAGLPLNPSLTGEVAYRDTQAVGTELKYGFGVKFGQFLFDKSVLEVKAAQYTTTGSLGVQPSGDDADKAFDPSVNYLYANPGTGSAGTLSGIYATWNYWDLAFTYGFFSDQSLGTVFSDIVNRTTTGTYGRVFRIQYTVTF